MLSNFALKLSWPTDVCTNLLDKLILAKSRTYNKKPSCRYDSFTPD